MSPGGAVALIGGLDPTGGAGLLRDAWTLRRRAPELERLCVCTALTRQGRGPARHAPTEPRVLGVQLARVASHPGLRAVKIGMVPERAVAALLELLAELRARPGAARPTIVWDPVIDASAGGRLGASLEAMHKLIERVDLLTPNQDERQGLEPPSGCAVLHKGEAVEGQPGRIRDRLRQTDGDELIVERPRLSGPDPRGTGCALASAIAAELARGRSLGTAVVAAIAWLDGARRRVRPMADGRFELI